MLQYDAKLQFKEGGAQCCSIASSKWVGSVLQYDARWVGLSAAV